MIDDISIISNISVYLKIVLLSDRLLSEETAYIGECCRA